jgi:hypothetical protein
MSRRAPEGTRSRIARALAFAVLSASAPAQETERDSVDSSGAQAKQGADFSRISANGRFVVFLSTSPDLVSGDTNGVMDIFVHDRATGVTERVSVDSSGAESNGSSDLPQISADGQTVVFLSGASNLVPGDTNGWWDIFVHERSSGVTERVNVATTGAQADYSSHASSISADGQIVAFDSEASNLVSGDTNGRWDVFVRDRTAGVTLRVSVDSAGVEGNGDSTVPNVSADGQVVAFDSVATNLVSGDGNLRQDAFVYDRASQTTERVSVRSNGVEGNQDSYAGGISSDGAIVSFSSNASNLVSGDNNGWPDNFVRDRTAGTTERVSVDSSGGEANYFSMSPSLSADGRIVAFASGASNLVPGDANQAEDIFTHDRSTGITELVSVDSSGAQGNYDSQWPWISGDGLVVTFESRATNLVSGDTNSMDDVFVRDRCPALAAWSNYGAGFPGTNGVPAITSRSNPVFGTTVTVDVDNSLGAPTGGLFLAGFSRQTLHSGWGGDLLVVPAITIPITFAYGGAAIPLDVPDGETLCGVIADLQAIEIAPGAAHGVSFTPGLELALGR